jgi:hypothetical protein
MDRDLRCCHGASDVRDRGVRRAIKALHAQLVRAGRRRDVMELNCLTPIVLATELTLDETLE